MHVLIRERHGLEEAAAAEDLGQAPADLVVLSFADSDLAAFAAAWRGGRARLPSLRLANLKRLAHPLSVDLYCEKTLAGARGILVRLLGGLDYWRYGVEQLAALARAWGIALAIVPGDGRDDPRLDAASNLPVSTLRRLETLCDIGGARAAEAALAQLALAAGLAAVPVLGVGALPKHGFYRPGEGAVCPISFPTENTEAPKVLVLFYRALLAAADTEPVDRLMTALAARGARPVGLFVPSLKDPETAPWLARWLPRLSPDVVVNATAFSARGEGGTSPLEAVDAPVLQVALAGSSRAAWASSDRGLGPADLAMHVVLPEVDGRLFAGVASFKQPAEADELGFAGATHRADDARIAAIAGRALGWARLRRTPRADRRIAVVLSAYPGRDDQLAHAVGLDAPASTAAMLHELAAAGFSVAGVPTDGDELISRLKSATVRWPLAAYRQALGRLDPALWQAITAAWGAPEDDPAVVDGAIRLRVLSNGNILVAAQPDRGARADRAATYHDPRRPPRHGYVALYLWLRDVARIDALVHMGAHGTLEWLPGKSVALSDACWPEALVGPLPVIYPFIVNDPGEAAAAKRRLGALTIGHMTPPMRSGAVPEGLHRIERLLDEYSTADGLDPRRRDALARAVVAQARAAGLDRDAGLDQDVAPADALVRLDAFVCDVKDTLFADGLHVFGRAGPDVPAGCAEGERAALLAALDGRAVAPGPAGSPWRGRADVLPTGRNLYAVDPRAVPSRAAAEEGRRLADALITRHLQDHGEYPGNVFVDLWGSATMRTAGEDFAMALALIGVVPTWDDASSRVSGFEIVPLAVLGRPRIDVSLRISGLFRDVFPGLPVLFEQAVAALAARTDEPADENCFVGKIEPRVFGPAPGAYGVGVAETQAELTPGSLAAAAEAWLDGSAHAYGAGRDGAPARAALERRAGAADAFVHTQDLPETDLLAAPDWAAHEAGFAAARRALTGSLPPLYHLDATRPGRPRPRSLSEEVARVVRGRAANPRWIAGQMRHGFRGAAEIAWTLDQMAMFAHLACAVASRHFDLYFDATLGDDGVRRFLDSANPAAAAAMRERFRQVIEAGYWSTRRNSVAEVLGADDARGAA